MSSSSEFKANEDILQSLLELLPQVKSYHSPFTEIYKYIEKTSKYSTFKLFGPNQNNEVDLGILGKIKLPYFSMGSINSTHLFGLDELILFAFYYKNRKNYKKVADLGANIGLHSIILSNLGFQVTSYEPDLIHFKKITENTNSNCLKNKPDLINKAISTKKGFVEFTRIMNNTTGSHISGSKDSCYGELEKITVETDAFKDIISNFDFLKIDIEGHEADVLLSTILKIGKIQMQCLRLVLLKMLKKYLIFLKNKCEFVFSKNNWAKVRNLDDMPSSYKEGSLFISCKPNVPW